MMVLSASTSMNAQVACTNVMLMRFVPILKVVTLVYAELDTLVMESTVLILYQVIAIFLNLIYQKMQRSGCVISESITIKCRQIQNVESFVSTAMILLKVISE